MGKLYVIGIGPGSIDNMSIRAYNTIKNCNIIVGYTKYIEMIKDLIEEKDIRSTGMKSEEERCKLALELAKDNDVALISTGDSGIYGMAGLILELSTENDNIEIIPGITASSAAGSVLGAPLMHDNCNISLSDLLTPYENIKKRVDMAAASDFVISLYNPRSNGRPHYLKECIEIIKKYRNGKTPIAVVEHALRQGQNVKKFTLEDFNDEVVNMMSIVIIGNSKSYWKDGYFITPRGYRIEGNK